MNLDNAIDSLLSPIADRISGIIFYSVNINGVEVQLLVALLMAAAFYFTFRMRFIGIWGFKHGLNLILNKYKHDDTIKRKKKGQSSCGCNCSGCASGCGCHGTDNTGSEKTGKEGRTKPS